MTILAPCASCGGGRRLRVASACSRIADFWDELTAAWQAGEDPLPDPLPDWYASYEGRRDGQVTRDAFAEPYVGDLRGTPRMVTLRLNPGRACLDFQGRNVIFAREIHERGSYSAWAAPFPYLGEEWSRVDGRNRLCVESTCASRAIGLRIRSSPAPQISFNLLVRIELFIVVDRVRRLGDHGQLCGELR